MISGTNTTRVDHQADQFDTDAAAVLASARRARATARAAEAQLLADAVDWAHLHVLDDPDDLDDGNLVGRNACPGARHRFPSPGKAAHWSASSRSPSSPPRSAYPHWPGAG